MSDWVSATLGDVLSVIKNGVNCKQSKSGDGQKISRIESIADASFNAERVGYAELSEKDKAKNRLEPGDILFSHINSAIHVGKTAIFNDATEIYHGVNLLLMRPTPNLSAAYLEFYLKYLFESGYWRSICNQSVNQASVNQQHVKRVPISFPKSLPEQQRIVAILDEAMAGIEAAIANTEQNLANARELFASYLNGVFSRKGAGWVEKTLGEVCSINSKLVDPREPEFIDLPHLGAGNMVSRTGELIEIKTAREEGLISGKFLFDEKMVLYSKIRPYLMKACMPDFKGLCSADVYPLSVINGSIDRSYLFHLLMSQHFTDYAISGSGRAGMPKVNRNHLFKYRVFLPDISEQKLLSFKFDELFEETQRLETIYQQKLTALVELKQAILHQAFAGELTARLGKTREEAVA